MCNPTGFISVSPVVHFPSFITFLNKYFYDSSVRTGTKMLLPQFAFLLKLLLRVLRNLAILCYMVPLPSVQNLTVPMNFEVLGKEIIFLSLVATR